MNPVVHFELPYENRERIARFYQSAFGWQTEMLGEEMGNYVLADNGAIGRQARRAGGRHQRRLLSRKSPTGRRNTRRSSSRFRTWRRRWTRVTSAGGKVLGDPMDIPGVGRYVSFFDTEGNRLSMLQPSGDMAGGS